MTFQCETSDEFGLKVQIKNRPEHNNLSVGKKTVNKTISGI